MKNNNKTYIGKKVIIGDYFQASANITKESLESFGINVTIVDTGKKIIDEIKKGNSFDIIFTNYIYKIGDDGIDTLRKLRELPNFNTPVVIHTCEPNARHQFVDIEGFDEYINKPVLRDNLKPILDKFLNNRN